ncbi:uncharacterized protein LOC144876903 isoform X2 [Branchiostoma floridae x Branchiostoma japonicum]
MAGADRDTTDLDQAVPFLPYQFEPEAGEDDSDTAEVEDRGNAERLTSLTWRYRYVAYRQLVRWCWGWLGARIRVINPACAVKKIRETFPSAQYTGFKYPPLD